MPKIPLYEPSVGMTPEGPGAMGDIAKAGLAGQAVEKLGETGLKITADFNLRLKHARMVNDLADANLSLDENLNELKKQIQFQDPEMGPETWVDRYKQGAKEHFEVIHQNLQNPEVQAHFKGHYGKSYHSGLVAMEGAARDRQINLFQGNFEKQYQRYVDLYIAADNDFTRAGIKGDLFGLIAGAEDKLYVHPAKAELARQGFEGAVAKGMANNEILNNPWGAFERLADPGKNYPGLDQETALNYRGRAQTEIHRLQEGNAQNLYTDFMLKKIDANELKTKADGLLGMGQLSQGKHHMFEAVYQSEMAGIKPETDYDLYWPMYQTALSKALDMNIAINARKAGKLTDANMNSLINLQEKGPTQSFMKEPILKKQFEIIIHDINDQLKPSEKILSMWAMGGKAMGALPHNEAASVFMQACDKAEEEGKLTQEFMWKKGQEIIQIYQKDLLQRLIKPKKPGILQRWFGEEKGQQRPGAPETGVTRPGVPASRAPLFNPIQGPKGSQQEKW